MLVCQQKQHKTAVPMHAGYKLDPHWELGIASPKAEETIRYVQLDTTTRAMVFADVMEIGGRVVGLSIGDLAMNHVVPKAG